MAAGSLASVLKALAARAKGPADAAFALPPAAYTSPEVLALEEKNIFDKDWLCAGRADDVAKPGDYLTFAIGRQLIFVVRGRDKVIRAFANVCRHRMMKLLEGRGTVRRVICPYHAWTYDLDGSLQNAPQMDRTPGFDKTKICLPTIRCEIWQGWIYVTLNDKAQPVADLLADLSAITARYEMGNYISVLTEDHVWDTNWKLLTENFMEGYHLPVAHRKTVGAWFPADDTRFPDQRHPAFTYQSFTKDETATYGRAHPKNTRLKDEERGTSLLPTIFPSHMIVLAPDHLWYLSLRPDGVGKTLIRFGVALAPEVHAALDDVESYVAEMQKFFTAVNAEDKGVVEGIFQGALAPLSTPGPLSWLERELHDFACYLYAKLNGQNKKQKDANA